MPRYDVVGPDKRTAVVEAPEGVSEQDALAYAQQNWASWADKGVYNMPAAAPVAVQADAPATESAEQDDQAEVIDAKLARLYATPGWKRVAGYADASPGYQYRTEATRKADPQAAELWDYEDELKAERLRATGRVQYGDSSDYHAAKLLAAIVGGSRAGPVGATAAESVVRGVAVARELDKAIKNGVVTEDEASDIMADEMVRGMGTDAAFNVGVPALMRILGKVPGVRRLGQNVAAKLSDLTKRAVGGLRPKQAPLAEQDELAAEAAARAQRVRESPSAQQLDRVVQSRQALATDDPAAKRAVAVLAERTEGQVPTPGQLTGEVGSMEAAERIVARDVFRQNDAALARAANSMIDETVRPSSAIGREALGNRIAGSIDALEKSAKERLGKVFKEGDDAAIGVDVSSAVAAIDEALKKRFALTTAEFNELRAMRDALAPPELANVAQPHAAWLAGQEAQDFISLNKSKLRSLNPDGKPSPLFAKIIGGINRAVDQQFLASIAKAEAGGAVRAGLGADLRAVRLEYSELMDDIYGDTGGIRRALKATPEDISGVFWQKGTVGEVKQLRRVLERAVKEKAITQADADAQMSSLTIGFLQENAGTLEKAAKWRELIRTNTKLSDSWNVLTDGPGGAELRTGMETLAAAAEIAKRDVKSLGYDIGIGMIPLSRAAQLGIGVSYVTGTISPGLAVVGVGVAGLLRAMAVATTRGNTGLVRDIARLLRATQAGTSVGNKVAQDILPRLEKFAAENDITDLFMGDPNARSDRLQ